MTAPTEKKDPVLVIIQLSGGNDFMNTLIPYTSGVYHDSRPYVGIPMDKALPLNETLGFHPSAGRLKEVFDAGDMAIVQGVGYPNASRSHFRGMDILHTCEPTKIATEGWAGKVIRELDPHGENPLTGVSFGRGLPRAMAVPGVTVTSIGNLDNYGLMTNVEQKEQRAQDLDIFKRIYTPAVGAGLVNDYLAQTAGSVLKGAGMLVDVPGKYASTVEYAANPIAQSLRDVARVHTAGLGTRLFYTQHAGYDHHSQEPANHARCLEQLGGAISDFLADLREHEAAEEVAILVFTEFGRRIKDNGSGTDHGSAGGSFIVGERVKGGLYSEYPSIEPKDWLNGEDMKHNIDFRGIYGTMIEQWLGLDPDPIVGGKFEQVRPFRGYGGMTAVLESGPSTAAERPYALLRAGFPYLTTLGMRRVTTYPMDVAFADDGRLFVLCRHDFPDLTAIRIINWDDEDLGTVEGTGKGGAGFVWPVTIAVGPDGKIYVADEGTNKISTLGQEGGFIAQWGEAGHGPGQFDRPSGFAFDSEGTIWVSDAMNHRLQRFTLEGKHIGGFGSHGSAPGDFDMPWGIAFDGDGNIVVADWRNDRVQRFTPAGELVDTLGSSGSGLGEFNRPAGIAIDAHGDIYVADRDNNRVQLFDTRGRYVDRFVGDATLSKIGRRYILANPKTLRLRDMSLLEQSRPFRTPASVRIDSEFRLYVADTGAHRVQVYKKEAYPLTEIEIFPEFKSPTLATT